jgi:hypothetical protein
MEMSIFHRSLYSRESDRLIASILWLQEQPNQKGHYHQAEALLYENIAMETSKRSTFDRQGFPVVLSQPYRSRSRASVFPKWKEVWNQLK